eukprot:scaffold3210_cov172-Amphora_coffeaeformis.AAC.2
MVVLVTMLSRAYKKLHGRRRRRRRRSYTPVASSRTQQRETRHGEDSYYTEHDGNYDEDMDTNKGALDSSTAAPNFTMPSEEERHEGTWLQWPHTYGWDRHRNVLQRYEKIWIDMTRALHTGERVHIIVYNQRQLRRVRRILLKEQDTTTGGGGRMIIDISQIDFWVYPTDDVWVRDNGPLFVYDHRRNDDKLVVQDWMFNGWGGKAEYNYDDTIPTNVARDLGLPRIPVHMVNEGGSIEVDGRGTLMAKKSSILNPNRNPGLSQADAEDYFRTYLGVSHFIWLEGQMIGADITDDHIDGTARFAGSEDNDDIENNPIIVTMARDDFLHPSEYDVLKQAVNAEGRPFRLVHLPITKKLIGKDPGIYVNYYVGNEVVLVPMYDDENDAEALRILADVYPHRKIQGINMVELYKDGGAAHCVTMQQPLGRS